MSVSTVCAQEKSAPAKSATGMNTDKRMPGMQENMKAMRGMGGGVHGGMMKGGDMQPRREMMEKRMDMVEQMMLRDLTKQSLPAK